MTPSFTYAAAVERVVDADTLDVAIDLGFRIQFRVRVRVAGIDAPELSTEAGKQAKAFVVRFLSGDDGNPRSVVLRTYKPDKYGRALADVALEIGGVSYDLAENLLEAGHAQPYDGGRRS